MKFKKHGVINGDFLLRCRNLPIASFQNKKHASCLLIFFSAVSITELCSADLLARAEERSAISSGSSASSDNSYDSAADYNKSAEEEFSYRLSEAGAKSGYLTVSLLWHNLNDIDLHCIGPLPERRKFNFKKESKYFNHPAKVKEIDPKGHRDEKTKKWEARALLTYSGGLQRWLKNAPKGLNEVDNYRVEHIFFGHKKTRSGEMDVDRNVEPTTRKPGENI